MKFFSWTSSSKYTIATLRLIKVGEPELTLPVDARRKLNVVKTFRRCPDVLCTSNLRLVSTGPSYIIL